LNLGSKSGSARRGDGDPLPRESDLHGQLLWMDNRACLALGEGALGLLRLQSRFIQHYFRLQRAERNLSSLAQQTRTPGRMGAVRQIELERARLGRDLHTGVGQLLMAIRLQLEVIASQLPGPPWPIQQALNRIATLASDAEEQVRALSQRLHPPEWQGLTLEAAVRQLWDNSGVPQRFEAVLRIQPLAREPEQETKVLVYRAVQEALANLARHSHASRVEGVLETQGDRVILNIWDNGVGFDVARLLSAPANVASGIGLRSIREQAAALGGRLDIASSPGDTRLKLAVPFVPSQS
jgi:two-component system NarL family sensor kinase